MEDATSMSTGWYAATQAVGTEGRTGPHSWEELYGLAQSGSLRPSDLVWHPSLPDWIPSAQVPGLVGPVTDSTAATAAVTAVAAATIIVTPPAVAAPPVLAPYAAPHVPAAGPYFGQPACAVRERRSRLPLMLLPLIALALVGGGLGSYFAFWHGGGSAAKVGGSSTTTTQLSSTHFALPDQTALVKTAERGLVPVDQLCVMMADDQGQDDAERLAKSLGGSVIGALEYINAYQIQTSGTSETDLRQAIDAARATAGVVLAFPNQTTAPAIGNEIWGTRISPLQDPAYAGANGEGYDLIGVQKAWDYIKGYGAGLLSPVQVGVVDTGLYDGNGQFDGGANISYTNPAARRSSPQQITYSDGTTGNDPSGGHGTGINTLIGADADDGGPAGIASILGNLLSISNTDIYDAPYGYGNQPAAPDPNDPSIMEWPDGNSYVFSDLAAIMAEVKAGSKVINLSWGPKDPRTVDAETAAVFKAFFEKMATAYPDVIFVAAAGNEGTSPDGDHYYPGGFSLPNLVTVGNTDNDGEIFKESNTSSDNFEVTVYAPGEQSVRGYDPTTGTVVADRGGTSMAAPQVAAAAALIKSINPNLDAGQIKELLQTSVRENDWGEPVLAVDEAVFNAINLNRRLAGLAEISREELLNAGAIDAVATPVPGAPDEYMVRAILQSPNTPEVEVSITPSSGTIEQGDSPRSVNGVGEVSWLVKMDDPTGSITVYRLDNKAGSRISLERVDINGHWQGTITFGEINIDQSAMSEEDKQGCDFSMLDLLKGKTVPMTLDITVDESGSGTATVLLDLATLNEGRSEAEGKFVSDPFDTQITYFGNTITFMMGGTSGMSTSLTGNVMGQAGDWYIEGVFAADGTGYSMKATWRVAR